MNNLSRVCLVLRRVTRALGGSCLLPFSFMDAEQPGQHWLTACSPALPFHNQGKMPKKENRCVLSFPSTFQACVGAGIEFGIAGASL